MPTIRVPYGRSEEAAQVPDDIPVDVIDHGRDVPKAPPPHLLEDAMDNPIGTDRLENLVSPKDKVSIVVNDHTRPGPTSDYVHSCGALGLPESPTTTLPSSSPRAVTANRLLGDGTDHWLQYCRFRLVPHD